DLRPLPGMDMETLRQTILSKVQPIAERRELSLEFEPLFDGVPPFETPADAALVKACEKLTGHTAHAVAFATEAPWLHKLGLETLVMGPGSIDQAHQPDEFIELSQLDPTVKVLRGLIRQFCL
ncbi:MAG: M20/M25/M40 family metallo-hydrolase, partial [Marinobacter sp.]|nr:M20/M25/M40 family metallo-hydrolase [Marinobacter sp.]